MSLTILMGRSGSGKSTIETLLHKKGLKKLVSYTTRKPQVRNGKLEEDGIDYSFISREQFIELLNSDKLLEYTEYNGNLYGTPLLDEADVYSNNYIAVLDYNGYRQLKNLYDDLIIGIYFKCSEEVALSRLFKRDGKADLMKSRKETDKLMSEILDKNSDYTVDTDKSTDEVLQNVLEILSENNINI